MLSLKYYPYIRCRLLWLFFLLCLGSYSYSKEFRVSASVDKDRIYIGDVICYRIRIEFSPGQKIRKPGKESIDTGAFIILSNALKQNKLPSGNIEDISTYFISIYELGEFKLPPVKIFAVEGVTNSTALKTRPVKIKVISVTNKLHNDAAAPSIIEENQPALPAGRIPGRYYVYLAVIIVIVGVIILLFLWRRYKKNRAAASPPFARAIRALDDLLKKNYPEKKLYKQFYYRFSMIIRTYIEQKYFIPCTTMTTRQIKKAMQQQKTPKHKKFSGILAYADKVKFARYMPDNKTTADFIKYFKTLLQKEKKRYEELKQLQKEKK
ncbi:MAG TPA: hypothetical protein VKS21_04670 [Spirochaetota bacterium]|nr:hypothetical protein [Spirochaetota bacterium]